jgi:2-polyprenyl-3-methyl-5-hydroxy-6-metoxy-1,4-benzoquinol methylase
MKDTGRLSEARQFFSHVETLATGDLKKVCSLEKQEIEKRLSANNDNRKGNAEINYWLSRYHAEGHTLANGHYEYFYTENFGLVKDYFNGKRILDIGCGPRGSLEWADNALVRIGLDPLANDYMQLDIAKLNDLCLVGCRANSIPK